MRAASPGRVLVTGGSGFIARYCILQLLEKGWHVRTTLRDDKKAARIRAEMPGRDLADDRLHFVVADLESDEGWDQAMGECDFVLHVASPLPTSTPKDDDELLRPARDGTLRVLRHAAKHGVRRVVITSSSAAISYGYGSRSAPFTETDWSEPSPHDTSAYERSKILAERSAWAWKQNHPDGPELVAICPAAVIGPVMGKEFSPSIQIIQKLIDGSLPGLPRIGFPLVDVRDVADLHVRALTARAAANQRYLASGGFFWMAKIAEMIRSEVPAVAGRVPKLRLPDWLVRFAALFDPVLRTRLFELGKYRPLSSAKAARELGWISRPVAISIRDTVRSLETLNH